MTNDSDADDSDATMWVVGIEHKLDKAVRVYANYAVVDNDDNVAYSPWMQSVRYPWSAQARPGRSTSP